MTDDINDVRHDSTYAAAERAIRKDERSRVSPETGPITGAALARWCYNNPNLAASTIEGLRGHAQTPAVQTIPLPLWAAEDILKYMRRIKVNKEALHPLGLENLLDALVSELSISSTLDQPAPFYGAQCPSYPNCTGGCGLGCTHEIERARAQAATPTEHGRHIPQTSPAPGYDSGSHLAQPRPDHVLVPIDPTPEMISAGMGQIPEDGCEFEDVEAAYRAMVAANSPADRGGK